MASSGTFFFLFIAIWISSAISKDDIIVQCDAVNVGYDGQQSLLNCVVKTSKGNSDVKIDTIAWKKAVDNTLLFEYHEGNSSPSPGYRLAEPSWDVTNMNVSLLIMNTTLTHTGKYACMVMTDSAGPLHCTTNLEVRARYSQPTVRSIPDEILPDQDSELICDSDGGFPAGTIHWFDEHKTDWTPSAKSTVEKMDNGRFHLSSKLPLRRGSTFSEYTCVVYNATNGIETQFTFKLPPKAAELGGHNKSDTATKVVAPVVVIGSLIVGLLLLLLYKRRSRHTFRGPASEYDPEKGDNQEMRDPLPVNQA